MTAAKKAPAKKATRKRTKPTVAEGPSPASLREALAAKRSTTTHYDIPLVDSETAERAGAEFAEVSQQLEYARAARNAQPDAVNPATWDALNLRYAEAEGVYRSYFWRVTFRGLQASDLDALVTEYGEESGADDIVVNGETFRRFDVELLAASTVGDEDRMTAEEWAEELASERWSSAERARILGRAIEANNRDFSDAIPKG